MEVEGVRSSNTDKSESINNYHELIQYWEISIIYHLEINVVEGYFYFKDSHWTKKLWQIGFRSLPVNERLFTLHQLSTNTILHLVKFKILKPQYIKAIGRQVPGPFVTNLILKYIKYRCDGKIAGLSRS